MELDDLKTSWNALDKRLAETEIVNMRMVMEMVSHKTKSAYDHIVGQNIYNLVVCILIICVVFPFVYMNTPIRFISFAIVEGVMVIGLIPQIWKISLLSKFNLEDKKCSELSRLVLRYKKVCHHETIWTIAAVCLAMVAFYNGKGDGTDRRIHIDIRKHHTNDQDTDHEVVYIMSHDAVECRLGLLRNHLLHHTHIHYFCFCQTLIKSVPTGLQIIKFHNLTI